MTTGEWNRRTKAYGIRLDRENDAELIEWLAAKKEEGVSLTGLVRKWIKNEIRKEQHYEH